MDEALERRHVSRSDHLVGGYASDMLALQAVMRHCLQAGPCFLSTISRRGCSTFMTLLPTLYRSPSLSHRVANSSSPVFLPRATPVQLSLAVTTGMSTYSTSTPGLCCRGWNRMTVRLSNILSHHAYLINFTRHRQDPSSSCGGVYYQRQSPHSQRLY